MDAAEYKHIVLGLIFLKYISDAFDSKYRQIEAEISNPTNEWFIQEEQARYETLNDKDEYGENWV